MAEARAKTLILEAVDERSKARKEAEDGGCGCCSAEAVARAAAAAVLKSRDQLAVLQALAL
jgi:hypothetical protein